jgi:hypothetical protein
MKQALIGPGLILCTPHKLKNTANGLPSHKVNDRVKPTFIHPLAFGNFASLYQWVDAGKGSTREFPSANRNNRRTTTHEIRPSNNSIHEPGLQPTQIQDHFPIPLKLFRQKVELLEKSA